MLALLLGAAQLCLGLAKLRLQGLGVEHRDHLPGLDPIALPHQHLLEAARQLGGHVHLRGLDPAIGHGESLREAGGAKETLHGGGQELQAPAGDTHPHRQRGEDQGEEDRRRGQPAASWAHGLVASLLSERNLWGGADSLRFPRGPRMARHDRSPRVAEHGAIRKSHSRIAGRSNPRWAFDRPLPRDVTAPPAADHLRPTRRYRSLRA